MKCQILEAELVKLAAEKEEIKTPKPVDKRNTLNDLNGTEWLPETKSFFYQKGLEILNTTPNKKLRKG